jgi:hypothetical protein
MAMTDALTRGGEAGGTAGGGGASAGAGEATKFCMHCGKPIPRSAKFCPECGAKQE